MITWIKLMMKLKTNKQYVVDKLKKVYFHLISDFLFCSNLVFQDSLWPHCIALISFWSFEPDWMFEQLDLKLIDFIIHDWTTFNIKNHDSIKPVTTNHLKALLQLSFERKMWKRKARFYSSSNARSTRTRMRTAMIYRAITLRAHDACA